jgi:hypothetical protein
MAQASILQRLAEFYRRLSQRPRASSADEAMEQLCRTLEEVEDEMSGAAKKSPPPPPSMPDGRMYPPLADHIMKHANGSILALTRGHRIEISASGGIVIVNNSNCKSVGVRRLILP